MADLSREGQSLTRPALAADGQLPGVRVDIVEGHGGDFSGPQAEPGQQAQHGIIPLADRRRPVEPLQLEVALDVRLQVPALILVSGDGDLNTAAAAEGLPVENPNTHP